MIGEAIKNKVVLNSYANQNVEHSPNDEEWSKFESVSKFLKTFEEATKAVSTDIRPTSHMFLLVILRMS
jgi:hypothetical protein